MPSLKQESLAASFHYNWEDNVVKAEIPDWISQPVTRSGLREDLICRPRVGSGLALSWIQIQQVHVQPTDPTQPADPFQPPDPTQPAGSTWRIQML
ncbi:hypothetical protein BGX20_007039, partial [Mortierella sp. AD010]